MSTEGWYASSAKVKVCARRLSSAKEPVLESVLRWGAAPRLFPRLRLAPHNSLMLWDLSGAPSWLSAGYACLLCEKPLKCYYFLGHPDLGWNERVDGSSRSSRNGLGGW